jgi:hypothetical protein
MGQPTDRLELTELGYDDHVKPGCSGGVHAMTEQHAELGKFHKHLTDRLMEEHGWEPKKAVMFAEKATEGWIVTRATRPPNEDVQS